MLRSSTHCLVSGLLLFAIALLFSGCGKVALFSDLSEGEANEMMAILLSRDLECLKSAGKDEKWVLKVSQENFSRAVELLKAQGYPRDKFEKIGQVFQKSGLVSSPTEERIRYMYALSQEIADTLMRIDGVMNARVHIVIPDNDPLAEKVTPSSAAVFIRYRQGFDLESLTPQLKNLVMRSIEGLNYDNVSLVLVPAVNPVGSPANKTSTGSRSESAAQDPVLMVALILAGVGLVLAAVWLAQRQLSRRTSNSGAAA